VAFEVTIFFLFHCLYTLHVQIKPSKVYQVPFSVCTVRKQRSLPCELQS